MTYNLLYFRAFEICFFDFVMISCNDISPNVTLIWFLTTNPAFA